MRRILVLRGGALGDFIVTLPALALLRDRWPEARIELAGNATAAQLALRRTSSASQEAGYKTPVARLGRAGTTDAETRKHYPLLDAVHSQHAARWSALFSPEPLPAEFAAWLDTFDLVVNWWPDPTGELRSHFPRPGGQVFLSGAAWPERAPAAAHYCATLGALGLTAQNYLFPLARSSAPRTGITIHPGSGSPRKNWPRDRWLALIAQLPAPITIVLGEAELALAPWPPRPGVTVLRQPSLEALAAHLASCRLFLGHDSGISHLAAACGAPSLLLFGPTDPAMWAPPAPHVKMIKHGPTLDSVSVSEVLACLEALPK